MLSLRIYSYTHDMKKSSSIKNRVQQTALDLIINPPTIKDAIFQHSVLCQTFLPYRNPGDDTRVWQHQQGKVSLAVQANDAINPENQKFEFVGLPYGTKARLILAHINSEAIKTGNKTIKIEDTMTSFIKSLGLSTDGRTIAEVKEQLRRLTTSLISLGYTENDRTVQVNFQIVKAFDAYFQKDEKGKVIWNSTIQLTDDYFNSLMNHAIPLDERALAALSNNAMALDIYAWLAQRLHRIPQGHPQFISWSALKEQFGFGYGEMRKFRQVFRDTLLKVRTQYQTARIEEKGTEGILLFNSPTPIPKQNISLLGKTKPENL